MTDPKIPSEYLKLGIEGIHAQTPSDQAEVTTKTTRRTVIELAAAIGFDTEGKKRQTLEDDSFRYHFRYLGKKAIISAHNVNTPHENIVAYIVGE